MAVSQAMKVAEQGLKEIEEDLSLLAHEKKIIWKRSKKQVKEIKKRMKKGEISAPDGRRQIALITRRQQHDIQLLNAGEDLAAAGKKSEDIPIFRDGDKSMKKYATLLEGSIERVKEDIAEVMQKYNKKPNNIFHRRVRWGYGKKFYARAPLTEEINEEYRTDIYGIGIKIGYLCEMYSLLLRHDDYAKTGPHLKGFFSKLSADIDVIAKQYEELLDKGVEEAKVA